MNTIITIPVYKETLSDTEQISLNRVLTILGHYPLCLFTHKDLDLTCYMQVFEEHNVKLIIEYFDKENFDGIKGYNTLMLSEQFYQRFADYDYMLLYQLDAYVFENQLERWITLGIDYVGAPTYSTNDSLLKLSSQGKIVGNGGFSLRKIKSFIDIHHESGQFLTFAGLFHLYSIMQKGMIKSLLLSFLGVWGYKNSWKDICKTEINEDILYSILVAKKKNRFHIPDTLVADYFAFEQFPSLSYIRTGGTLPFGCHGWEKYEKETFWAKHINILGSLSQK